MYTALAEVKPDGFRYATFRLADGVTFVHVAQNSAAENPLASLPAFAEFQREISERVVEPPEPSDATVVGSIRLGRGVTNAANGAGTREDPWRLDAPAGQGGVRDVGGRRRRPARAGLPGRRHTAAHSQRAIEDLHAMLEADGGWVPLGGADEQKPAAEGTVEAWGRSPDNPVGGWYGLKKGLRGRFGVYLPPLLEALGQAELTHEARNNEMRAR